MLLAAQCHLGSKNLQTHMEPYLWKTRPDGINVINVGKTWYAMISLFFSRLLCAGFDNFCARQSCTLADTRALFFSVSQKSSRIG